MKTPKGIEVKVGQVWKDRDVRMNGRHCKVVELLVDDGKVRMRRCSVEGLEIARMTTLVSVRRMKPTSMGWDLVKDVE